MKKIYCYVDETGQDKGSDFFIVVVVASDKEQDLLRNELIKIESLAKIGKRKWHKTRSEIRLQYLQQVISKDIGKSEVYFSRYQKPIPYFFPMLETVEKAIKDIAEGNYKAIIYVDGIDKKKAAELTSALRLRGIRLEFIRGCRDESEPLIRLADRWAGCIRASFLGEKEEKEILVRAEEREYIKEV